MTAGMARSSIPALLLPALLAAAIGRVSPAVADDRPAGPVAPPAAPAIGRLLPDDPEAAAFVRANLVFVLHHEIAHALIDLLSIPVQGREEDLADALSVWLIGRLSDAGSAAAVVGAAAEGFLLYDRETGRVGEAPPWWGQHSLDIQRYYTLVCLFYGADPAAREDFADRFALPPERRESCPEEVQMAGALWEQALDGMPPQDGRAAFRLRVPAGRDELTRLVADELEALNGAFGLPGRIDVTVESCGEPNAFYEPHARRVVICTEYPADLARLRSAHPRD